MSGGLAVLIALVGSCLFMGAALFAELRPYWAGMLLVFGMGLIDDWVVLTPRTKLAGQVLGALAFLGLMILEGGLGFTLWLPVIFIWILGVTNSLNLLDNMDGLTPGVGAIAALAMVLISFGSTSPQGFLLLAMAGSLSGFLVFNFPPARVFLGDSGSHLTGFTLAALPVYAMTNTSWTDLAIPGLILLIPIADTSYVIISRIRRGQPIWEGGKDHLSHRLHERGFSERTVALTFYLGATLTSAAGYLISLNPR